MNRRTPARSFPLLAALLLLVVDLTAGVAAANHATNLPTDQAPDTTLPVPSTIPTIDQAYEDLRRAQEAQVKRLNEELRDREIAPSQFLPAVAARVLEDRADNGTRIGGVGNWSVIGGNWRVDPTIGANETAGWTMTNATTGLYGHMDSWLVTPMLDLSAYVIQTGRYPFISSGDGALTPAQGAVGGSCPGSLAVVDGALGGALGQQCRNVNQNFPNAQVIQNQTHLVVRQRYNFPSGNDGGQVAVFTSDPSKSGTDHGIVINPAGTGSQAFYHFERVNALNGRGFSGARDWHLAVYDLTPWAGKAIWVGFRVATVEKASQGTGHLDDARSDMPYGWVLDDVEVTTPAYTHNLKVVGIDAPAVRVNPADSPARVVPGENVTIYANVLHAGGSERLAKAVIRVDGLGGGVVEQTFEKQLVPGEVWRPNVTVRAPSDEGAVFHVRVRATNPGALDGQTLPDPTPVDNNFTRAFKASAVRLVDLQADATELMVDEGGVVFANASLLNQGNVPVRVTVHLVENHSHADVSHASHVIQMAPGERVNLSWPVTTDVRGTHALTVTATVEKGDVFEAKARYYVHTAPPILFDGRASNLSNWTAVRSEFPIPDGSALYLASGAGRLRVRAFADLPATEFRDLHLVVRSMGAGTVALVYAAPVDQSVNPRPVWQRTLWGGPSNGGDPALHREMGYGWQVLDTRVQPSETNGYIQAWNAGVLELQIRGGSGFYLDSLSLTGVPVSADGDQRIELMRVTGDENARSPTCPLEHGGTVCPALPVVCKDGSIIHLVPEENCWSNVNETQAAAKALENIQWNREPSQFRHENGNVPIWGYIDSQYSQRLVTPPIQVTDVEDAVLFLNHRVAFYAYPEDYIPNSFTYQIKQIAFVELQYKRDDGTWSNFIWLQPDGGDGSGYPHPLGRSLDNKSDRNYVNNVGYRGGSGFYYPLDCALGVPGNVCVEDGYVNVVDGQGRYVWTQFEPTPFPYQSVFSLSDLPVDLTNREIRLGFRVTTGQGAPAARWLLDDIRVAPVSTFAVDGALVNVSLDLPYDWRTLGVGPDGDVPVNVTVRNVGRYADEFGVTLTARRLGGDVVFETDHTVGRLQPEESRSFLVPWSIPASNSDGLYVIEAEVWARTGTDDENPFNDRMTLGADGTLAVAANPNVAVEAVPFPSRGRPDLARSIPIFLHNRGNVDLTGIEVVRTVEQLSASGRVILAQQGWRLDAPLPAGPTATPIQALQPDPPIRPEDLFYTPTTSGTYVVTVSARLPSAVEDQDPEDNVHQSFLMATESIAYEDFEDPHPWQASDASVWDVGEGFRSPNGMVAKNRTTGLLPAYTDAWVTTDKIPFSRAQTALANLFARYDLERGYDGVVVEASTDGETWVRVPPSDDRGRPLPYPVPLVASNPLHQGTPEDVTRAISGDSRAEKLELDGWVPLSFELTNVPSLTESVVFRTLTPPTPDPEEPISYPKDLSVGSASWLSIDENDPDGRWEVRNETGVQLRTKATAPPDDKMWWSGWASTGASSWERTLSRRFTPAGGIPEDGLPADARMVLTWWDHRAGTEESGWQGVGGKYQIQIIQPRNLTHPDIRVADEDDIQVLAEQDGWYLLGVELPSIVYSRFLDVQFRFTSRDTSPDSSGWAIEDIDLRLVAPRGGQLETLHVYTGSDEEDAAREAWTSYEFQRVSKIPTRPTAWDVVEAPLPDGSVGPVWRFAPTDELRKVNLTTYGSIDSRVVTPAVDLGEVGSARSTLVLTHRYDLNWSEVQINLPDWHQGKDYQAGAVEVQIRNRSTGRWDPWQQLFANPEPPTQELRDRTSRDLLPDEAPYTATLVDSGDTFERFPRLHSQHYGTPGAVLATLNYYRNVEANVSYVFSDKSDGYVTSTFDLSRFSGERVRFAFHGWATPRDKDPNPNFWDIARAEVVSTVLSAPDGWLRFRLGTDGSVRNGSFALDQFEVTGQQYQRSVAVNVKNVTAEVAPGEPLRIEGVLRNHGPHQRQLLGVGLRFERLSGEEGIPQVTLLNTPLLLGAGDYLAAAGPYDLAGAGEEGDAKPFTFLVLPDQQATYRVTLELIEGAVSGGVVRYSPAQDDVPGRARRIGTLTVQDELSATLETTRFDPPSLQSPGDVVVHAQVRNTGTLPLDLSLQAAWQNATSREEIGRAASPVVHIEPGTTATLSTAPLALENVSAYVAQIAIVDGDETIAQREVRYQVGVTDVILESDFETSFGGWSGDARFIRTQDDRAFGNWSILFGVTDAQYANGSSTDMPMGSPGATLTSPTLDWGALGPDGALSFWHKPMFGSTGTVTVSVRANSATPGCADWINLASFSGRTTGWEYVRLPLGALTCPGTDDPIEASLFEVRFTIRDASQQGWRLDGVAVTPGGLSINAGQDAHLLVDSAQKEFPLLVRNDALVRKDVAVRVHGALSKVTEAQREWLSVEPPTVSLEPGESRVVTLKVDTPQARGAFPQTLGVALSLEDDRSPFTAVYRMLRLDFRPQPRADLALVVSIDGKSLVGDRFPVEEAVPHELTVVVTNDGLEASAPTEVLLRVIEDATGKVIWEQRSEIESLAPYVLTEDAAIVSASWKPEFGARGNRTLRVIADPNHQQVDYDRFNDDLRIPIEVVQLIRPDVVVDPKAMRILRPDGRVVHETTPGALIQVEGIVRNDGFADAREVTVRLLAGASVLKEELIPVLRPGESRVVRANQFAPPETVTYRVLAFTPDLELIPTNNERSIELPIFPPEIVLTPEAPQVSLRPGEPRDVSVRIANEGPYPLLVDLSLGGERGFARLQEAVVALGPGESRNLTLHLAPSARELAREALVVVRAEARDGPKSQLTLPIAVEETPAIMPVVHLARGAPGEVRVEFDAVNVGNVGLTPDAVLRDASGAELARATLDPLPPGQTRFQAVTLALPPSTLPGAVPMELVLEERGRSVGRADVEAWVQPWGRLSLAASPGPALDGRQTYELTLRYDGNVPTARAPLLFGLPEDAKVRFNASELRLAPGEEARVAVEIAAGEKAPSGLYHLKAGFVDLENASGGEADLALTTLPFDLRRARLDLVSVNALHDDSPSAGDTLSYVARLRNAGERNSEETPVALYVDGLLAARETLPALAPGESRDVRFSWEAAAGKHAIVVAVDPHGPHGNDTAAFASTVTVRDSAVPGAAALKRVPAPDALALLALAAAALAGIGRKRRCG